MFTVNDPTLTEDDAAQAKQLASWQETVISFKGAFWKAEKQKHEWFGGNCHLFLVKNDKIKVA